MLRLLDSDAVVVSVGFLFSPFKADIGERGRIVSSFLLLSRNWRDQCLLLVAGSGMVEEALRFINHPWLQATATTP
jgi:hypothetical protein